MANSTTGSVRALIGLGSNMGDKARNLAQATALLAACNEITITGRSKLYRTEAWGEEDQDWFVNACLEAATTLTPDALLEVCQSIENDLGRVRDKRWGPRVIDLDILVYDDVEQADPDLTLPHPLITERAFVLVPMHDLAPDYVLKGKSVADWVADIDTAGVSEFRSGDG